MLITDDQSMSKFTLRRFVGKNMLIFSGTITCLPLALVMVVEPRPAFKAGEFTRYAMIIILDNAWTHSLPVELCSLVIIIIAFDSCVQAL
jgi:hypothetical protein